MFSSDLFRDNEQYAHKAIFNDIFTLIPLSQKRITAKVVSFCLTAWLCDCMFIFFSLY